MDVDLAITEPLSVSENNKIYGKIVDAPNPPLEVLEHIYAEAGIHTPPHSPTDWSMGATLDTNFNGGFTYIPKAYWSTIDKAWKHWAEYLFTRPHLFSDPRERTHIDQISFSMAVAQTQLPYGHLTSNMNYPCHKDVTPFNYDENSPVKVLHFHNGLDQFGLIKLEGQHNSEVHSAVEKANQAISEIEYLDFFELFKKSLVKPAGEYLAQAYSIPLPDSLIAKSQHNGKKRRLILHAGTPKTGTTSLQFFLNENREKLAEQGFWYPISNWESYAPKHQTLVNTLNNSNNDDVFDKLEDVLGIIPQACHTILLSTEGFYNHWQDYSDEKKYLFSRFANLFDFELWTWFREPCSFSTSLYIQCLKNPTVFRDVPQAYIYGQDLSFLEMLDVPWFEKQLDYFSYISECSNFFGNDNVRSFIATQNTIKDFTQAINFDAELLDEKTENVSLSATGVNLLRVINQHELDKNQKSEAVKNLKMLDHLWQDQSTKYRLSDKEKYEVNKRTALSWKLVTSSSMT